MNTEHRKQQVIDIMFCNLRTS